MKGIITKIVRERGFGFIRPAGADRDGRDLFFHASSARDVAWESLREGLSVEFEPVRDPAKGDYAVNVRLGVSHLAALAQTVHALVEERHPRGRLNGPQTVRLGAIKLIEETLEAATAVALPANLSAGIDELGAQAAHAFRERAWLDTTDGWTEHPLRPDTLADLSEELTDVLITALHLAHEVALLRGEPWDVEAAVLGKATADLVRP